MIEIIPEYYKREKIIQCVKCKVRCKVESGQVSLSFIIRRKGMHGI